MTLADRVALKARTVRPDAEIARNADPVTMEEFGALLAQGTGASFRSKAGTSVSANRMLGITAWYSGVRYLCESVAGLPWHVYSHQGRDKVRKAKPYWLEQPDVEQPLFGFWEQTMMALLHRGNAFAFKLRDPNTQQVMGLREIHPDRVTGGIAPDNTKRFMIDHDPEPYTTRDVLHIPGLAYNGRFGLNPIQIFANPLGSIVAADDYASRFFSGSTHIGGLISVPQDLSPTEALRLRTEWDTFHQGLINAHKTGVLSKGATYQRISLSAADSQLIETRRYGISEVSRMLRIPPHKLYELTQSTNNNIEHQGIEAVTDSITPWVNRIEAWINHDRNLIVPGNFLEATMEGLQRGDTAARYGGYTAAINAGWMMPATAARLENQPAGPELEYYLRPLNMAVLGEDPQQTQAGAQNT